MVNTAGSGTTPPNTSDSDYAGSAGTGGAGGPVATDGTAGSAGRVVLYYLLPGEGVLSSMDVTPVSDLTSATNDYSAGFTYNQTEATSLTFDFSAFGTGSDSMDLSPSSTTIGAYTFGGFSVNPTGVAVNNITKTISFTGGTLAVGAHTIDNAVAGTGWRLIHTGISGTQPVTVTTATTTNTVALTLQPSWINGTWNQNSAGNWSDTSKWTIGNVADGMNATATLGNFIDADRIITLDSARTIGNITAADTSHNYTISGANTLTLDRSSGTPTINVTTSGRKLTISSVINGSDGLLKSGAGDLTMTALNTFSGGIKISGGRIIIYDNANEQSFLGHSANVLTFTGNATLQNDNDVVTIPQGIAVNNGVTATFSGANQEYHDVDGPLTGDGQVTITMGSNTGGANFNSTANTFTGTLRVGSAANATVVTMNSLADSANPLQIGGGAGSMTFNYGSAAITPLVLSSRAIELTGTTGAVTLNNNNTASSFANTITITSDLLITGTGNKTLTLGGSNTGNNTFAGAITNAPSSVISLTKSGGGTWCLSGTNTYSGKTFNNSANGTLILRNVAFSLPSGSALTTAINSNQEQFTRLLSDTSGTITLGNTVKPDGGGSSGTGTMTIFVGNNGAANGGNGAGGTTGSTIVLGTLDLRSSAESGLVDQRMATRMGITGANGYNLQIGAVILQGQGTASANGAFFNPTTASMIITGTVKQNNGRLAANVAANQKLTLDGTSTGNLISGAIKNATDFDDLSNPDALALNLVKSSSSTWTLSGENTYSGTTTISGGQLRITSSTALGSTGAGTTQSGTSALEIDGSGGAVIVGAEALSINGGGITNLGALRNIAGNNTYGGTVTLAAQSRINSDSGTLTLDNATAVTGAGQNLVIGGVGNITICGAITTTTGFLTKDGAGTLTLSDVNTYSGATTVSAGKLLVNSPGSLASGSAVTVASLATLGGNGTINGTVNASAGALLSPGASEGAVGTNTLANGSASALTLNGNGLYFDVLSNDGSSRDQIAITGNLFLNGVNTLYINAPAGIAVGTYPLMTFAAKTGTGSIVFPNGSSNMTAGGSTLTISVGSTSVTLEVTGASVNADVWSGAASYAWDGAALNWTRNGTPAQAFADGDTVTFDDTGAAASTITSGGPVSPASVLFNNSVKNYTVSAVIDGTNTPLIKMGSGSTTLTGANSYTGTTTIIAGQLRITDGSALGSPTAGTTQSGTSALEIDGSGGDVTVGAETLSINGTGVSSGGALRNIAGNNTYGGLITLAAASRVNSDSDTLTLDVASGDAITGTQNLSLGGAGNITVAAPIATGTGTVTKDGAGTLTLSGGAANTYSGATTVSAGTLVLDKSGSAQAVTGTLTIGAANNTAATVQYTGSSSDMIGAGAVTINGRGILDFNGKTDTIGGNLTLAANGATGSNPTPIINTAGGGNLTIGGTIGITPVAGFTSVINLNGGTLTLGNNVTFTAATTGQAQITGGTLALGAAARTFTVGTASAPNYDLLVDAVISGAVGITKSGAGTLALSGANTFSGAVTISASGGTLSISSIDVVANNNPLGKSSAAAANLLLGNGTTLKYTGPEASCNRAFTINGTGAGHSATLDASGTGALSLTSSTSPAYGTANQTRTLYLTGSSTNNNTLAANIANNGTQAVSLSKTGPGSWTLSGNSTYGGGTTIGSTSSTTNVGTLNITHSSALGTGLVSIVSNTQSNRLATLTLNSDTGIAVANHFNTSGEGQGNNGIIRNFTGTNTIRGTISLIGGGGNTRIQSDGGTLLLSGAITNGLAGLSRTLFLSGSATGTVSGVIANGSITNMVLVTKEGSGTWTLSGTNTYTGVTTINAGTLALGANNTLDADNNIILNGGTLSMGNFTNSLGTLTVTADSTIALGAGSLAFADSSGATWTHNLALTGALGTAQLRFGEDTSGVSDLQLARIRINGNRVMIIANGYIIPVSGSSVFRFR